MSVILNLLNPWIGSHFHNIYLILTFIVFICGIVYTNSRRERRKKGSFGCDAKLQSELPENNFVSKRENNDCCSPPFLPFKQHIPYRPDVYPDEEMVAKSRDFYELMNKRRAVRTFRQDSVPIDAIKNAIMAAGTGPSGVHTQPWTYVIVTDQKVRQEIRKAVEEEEKLNYERRMSRQWVKDLEPLGTGWEKPYLTDAAALLLIFRQFQGIRDNGEFKAHYFCELSVGIAAGILAASLQIAGLASVPTVPLNCGPRLRTLLSRPNNEKFVLLFAVGKASYDCKVPDLERKPVQEYYFKM